MNSNLRKTLLEKKVVSFHISRETLIEYLTESYCLMTRNSITDLNIWKKKPPNDLQSFIDNFFKDKQFIGLTNEMEANLKSPKAIKREDNTIELNSDITFNYQPKRSLDYSPCFDSPKRLKGLNVQYNIDHEEKPNLTYELNDDLLSEKLDKETQNKISALRKSGMWPSSMLPKIIEYPHPLTLHDYMKHEIKWMAFDFYQERKWKTMITKQVAGYISKLKKLTDADMFNLDKRHVEGCQKIASMIKEYWNKILQQVYTEDGGEVLKEEEVAQKDTSLNASSKSIMKDLLNSQVNEDQQHLLDIILPNFTLFISRDEVEELIQKKFQQYEYDQHDNINKVYSSVILSDDDLIDTVALNLDAPGLISKEILQDWKNKGNVAMGYSSPDPNGTDSQDVLQSTYAQPKSLFDKPSPVLIKLRKEVKGHHQGSSVTNDIFSNQGHFQPQLVSKTKGSYKLASSAAAGQHKITDLNLPNKWIITEAWALLKAIKFYQCFHFGTIIICPGQTPNWDFSSEFTTSVSCTYRSPKECRAYYENIIVPREKNTLSLRDYVSNCKKPKIKHLNKLESGPLLTYKMYQQDKNVTYKNFFVEKMANVLNHRIRPDKHTSYCGSDPPNSARESSSSTNNPPSIPNEGSVNAIRSLINYGINYGAPVDPFSLLKSKIDRMVREKKHQQIQAKNLVPEFSATIQAPKITKMNTQNTNNNSTGPIVPEATYPTITTLQGYPNYGTNASLVKPSPFPCLSGNVTNPGASEDGNSPGVVGGTFTKICPKMSGQQTFSINSPSQQELSKATIVSQQMLRKHLLQQSISLANTNNGNNLTLLRTSYYQSSPNAPTPLSIQPKPVINSNTSSFGFTSKSPSLNYLLATDTGRQSHQLLQHTSSNAALLPSQRMGVVYSLLSSADVQAPTGLGINKKGPLSHTYHLPGPESAQYDAVATTKSIGPGTAIPLAQVYGNLLTGPSNTGHSYKLVSSVLDVNKRYEKGSGPDPMTRLLPQNINLIGTASGGTRVGDQSIPPTQATLSSQNVLSNFKFAGLEFLLNSQTQQQQQQHNQNQQNQYVINNEGIVAGGQGGLSLSSTNIYNLIQQHANSLKLRAPASANLSQFSNIPSAGLGTLTGQTGQAFFKSSNNNINLVSMLQQTNKDPNPVSLAPQHTIPLQGSSSKTSYQMSDVQRSGKTETTLKNIKNTKAGGT